MVLGLSCFKHNYKTSLWDSCPYCEQERQNEELIKQAKAQTEELKRQTKLQQEQAQLEQDIATQKMLEAQWKQHKNEYDEKLLANIKKLSKAETVQSNVHQSFKTAPQSNYLGISKMKCSNCSNEIVLGQKFCSNCGNSVEYFCKSCNQPLPNDANFCPECGAKCNVVSAQNVNNTNVISQIDQLESEAKTTDDALFDDRDWWSSWWTMMGVNLHKIGNIKSEEQDLSTETLNRIFSKLKSVSVGSGDWEVLFTLMEEDMDSTEISLTSNGDLFNVAISTSFEDGGNFFRNDMSLEELKGFFAVLCDEGPLSTLHMLPMPPWEAR